MRRFRGTKGLTIAELIIAFVLVLLLLLYTMSSFVASQNYIKRGKEFSTALFLSQTKMEELQVTPISDIVNETGAFEVPFERYEYRIELSNWDGELQQLEVIVTSPRGAIARINTLRQSQGHQGIIADPATNTVAFTKPKPDSDVIHYWDDAKGALKAPSKKLDGGELGGLAGLPEYGYVWAVDTRTNTLIPYREGNPESKWEAAIPFPPVKDLGPSRLSGIASDAYGNLVYIADWSNRGVWVFTDGLPGYPRGFLGKGTTPLLRAPRPHAPVSPPLGIPSGIATDPSGSLVVVADTENQCLRKLFVNLASGTPPEEYPMEQLEKADGVGYWHKERFRHPKGMGAPQGVAINSSGWAIYTVDRAYIYQVVEEDGEDPEWERYPLPENLTQSSPTGLALDEFNNLVFITTRMGELWKFNLTDKEFTRLDPAGE